MDFDPSPSQQLIVDSAADFAARVLAPQAKALDQQGGFPRQSLQQAAQLGLLGINVSEDLGGAGAGAVAYCLAVMELAKACASTTVAMTVSNMVAEVIACFGSSDQQSQHVPRLCSGEYVVGGFALSEAEAGSDPSRMQTQALRRDGGWLLRGSKLWITSGSDAGLFVVWARSRAVSGSAGISAFLVPGDAPGLVRGACEEKMGQHGSPTTALHFNDVELPEEALLGEEGKGFQVAMMALDGGRIGIAALAYGCGWAATEWACNYAGERQQFGTTIGNFQAIQWMLSDSATELEAGKLLALRAAWLKQQKQPFTQQAAQAKLFCSEKANIACDRALQILGGLGYTRDVPVERFYRDVRVTRIYEGTSEIQRLVLSRSILKRFAQRGGA